MCAGIVASTMRRRTKRHKSTIDARYMYMDPSHLNLSPTGPPSRSPSFMKSTLSRSPSEEFLYRPNCCRLFFKDFWPACLNPDEQNLRLVEYDTFDTLIPNANSWLQENPEIHIVKCETMEKKISSVDEPLCDTIMFRPKGNFALYIKGLRIWYLRERGGGSLNMRGDGLPIEVGYMNVIPKCLDSSQKYPVYENLSETYAAINAYLAESPLEGKILTIETVPLKLPRRGWEGPEVDPDQTYFTDEYLRHVLYITRIYFIYGTPEMESICVKDFLPEFIESSRWYAKIYGIKPKYSGLASAVQKVRAWTTGLKDVRVTNMQTMEAVFRGNPENVQTDINFVDKVESCAMVRFIRVTYVVPRAESSVRSNYYIPTQLTYKTFIPAAIKVEMCSGLPEYEPLAQTWERARHWLKVIDKRIVCTETSYHSLNHIWHRQDGGETTVTHGEWTSNARGERKHRQRRQLVHVIRVFLEGDYSEPPNHLMPPPPTVEEVNDCCCTIL